MPENIEFGLFCFTSFFTMVNPLGVIPIFTALTANLTHDQSVQVARRATLTALIILILFALGGQLIFEFFSITANSMRVVGGIVIFIMGYDMLQARLSSIQVGDEATQHQYLTDIAITPLAIPVICGPGAITSAILLMEASENMVQRGLLILSILLVFLIMFISLISGQRISKFLGYSGNKVVLRLMGLIVMVIAVEFFFAGLKPILRDIFKIN